MMSRKNSKFCNFWQIATMDRYRLSDLRNKRIQILYQSHKIIKCAMEFPSFIMYWHYLWSHHHTQTGRSQNCFLLNKISENGLILRPLLTVLFFWTVSLLLSESRRRKGLKIDIFAIYPNSYTVRGVLKYDKYVKKRLYRVLFNSLPDENVHQMWKNVQLKNKD